jgi:hypothetical protein
VYDQLSDAWELDGNIVTLRWRDPASNFYSKRVLVSYVPDPTQESEVQILRRSGNRVFADNVPMPFGYLQEDPVLPEFLNSREGGPFRKEEFQEFLRTHYANEPPKD